MIISCQLTALGCVYNLSFMSVNLSCDQFLLVFTLSVKEIQTRTSLRMNGSADLISARVQ